MRAAVRWMSSAAISECGGEAKESTAEAESGNVRQRLEMRSDGIDQRGRGMAS